MKYEEILVAIIISVVLFSYRSQRRRFRRAGSRKQQSGVEFVARRPQQNGKDMRHIVLERHRYGALYEVKNFFLKKKKTWFS